jgi:hypothetical protein
MKFLLKSKISKLLEKYFKYIVTDYLVEKSNQYKISVYG